jgi:hypothetical protein
MTRARKRKEPTSTGLDETQRTSAQDDSPSSAEVSLPIETCGRCSRHPVGSPHACFKLDCGCASKICAICFSGIVASAGAKGFVPCQVCDQKITAWDVFSTPVRQGGRHGRQGRQDSEEIVKHALKQPDADEDPVLFHGSGDAADPFYGLTLTYWDDMTTPRRKVPFAIRLMSSSKTATATSGVKIRPSSSKRIVRIRQSGKRKRRERSRQVGLCCSYTSCYLFK